ncbi:hypothetical protein ACEN9H_08435 [Massilia cellulosiltytica]|uniref:hypothetical protein n=1 Tax=Massilia cellulosiltytica TaxID=2683234 RepID=UPI0039B37A66
MREEGDIGMTEQVERYARELPPLDTERRKMQRAILSQVEERLQQHDKNEPQAQNSRAYVSGSDERDTVD